MNADNKTHSTEYLWQRIDELSPWRYNHVHGDIVIRGNEKTARVHDEYGRDLMRHLVSTLIRGADPVSLRALDLGCLEGHYSDVLCSLGFGEVVSIDISPGHVERAKFLLQELRGYKNSTVIHGNVNDVELMRSLGKFNIIVFHGLLYHLKDPLLIFDTIENYVPEKGIFYLLLSTQYFINYASLVSPMPLAEIQVKSIPKLESGEAKGLLINPRDGSVFERCSTRLNPAGVFQVLQAYNYQGLVAYDTPSRYKTSFHSNLVVSKERCPELVTRLNEDVKTKGVRFYEWDGKSVDSYFFQKRMLARVARTIMGVVLTLIKRIGKLDRLM